ncbi:MAG: MFS transporter [Promethearchaeota archaeon]
MNVKKMYGVFFLVYFTLGVFEAYFGLYIPLFYYEILAVNRNSLAFIQFFGYLSLIITPLVAYIFDAHVKSERNHKIFVYLCVILLCSCFSIFLINKNILFLYGIFLGVYFLARMFIRTIMSKVFLTLSVESPKIKHRMILIVNGARGISFLLVSLFFDLIIKNIYSLPQWELFFMVGWMLTLPLLSIILFLRNNTIFSDQSSKNNIKDIEGKNIKKMSQKRVLWFVIFLYIAFFLASSDLIFLSLVSSWVLTRYNEFSLRIFFSLYYVISIFALLGYYIASKIAKRISNIFLLFVFCCFYLFFLVLLPFSNFPMFLVIQCGLAFAGYIANYMYVSIAQTISVKTRYKTFVYQLILTCQSIANIVFAPIGTSLSAYISVEMLIFLSSIFLAFSCGIQLILVLVNKIKQIKEFD